MKRVFSRPPSDSGKPYWEIPISPALVIYELYPQLYGCDRFSRWKEQGSRDWVEETASL